MAESDGQLSVREEANKPKCKRCYNCNNNIYKTVNNFVNNLSCKACNSVYFCCEDCQQASLNHHQLICNSISKLKKQQRDKIINSGTYQTTFNVKTQSRVASLVGEKCLVNCLLNGKVQTLLLDSGAQVSMMSKQHLDSHYPDTTVKSMNDILDDCDSFRVQWGNTSDIPFCGWVDINVSVPGSDSKDEIKVPFLITTDVIDHPILGFNAIKILIQNQTNPNQVITLFQAMFQIADPSVMESVINLIQQADPDEVVDVFVKGKDVTVPAGKMVNINCKAKVGFLEKKRAMIFQCDNTNLPEGLSGTETIVMLKPGIKNYFKVLIVNDSNHDITIRRNAQIGFLEYVKTIVPLEVRAREQHKNVSVNKISVPDIKQLADETAKKLATEPPPSNEHVQKVLNAIDLSSLKHRTRKG